MSKRHAFKNSSNYLVLTLKQIPTISADTVPLSVQFEQIQAAARQKALQENISHTSQFLQNIKLVNDTTLPIDPATSEFQQKSLQVQLPLINDFKDEPECNITNKEDIIKVGTIHTAGACSLKTLSALSYHQLQGKGTKSQLTVSIEPFITDILQSYISPQYLNTNNNILFEIPHSTQFYNVLATILTTSFPLDGDPDNQQQQITEVSDQEEQFQPEPEQFDVFTHEFKVKKHLVFHESLDEVKPIQLSEGSLAHLAKYSEIYSKFSYNILIRSGRKDLLFVAPVYN